MKGLVYTAIIGGRDKPLRVRVKESNVDYLMFTDSVAPSGWQEVRVKREENPRLQARRLKVVLPPQAADYDWTLWIDGSHIPQVPILGLVQKWLEKKPFAAFKHHHWDCSYTEVDKCGVLGKERQDRLKKAGKALLDSGFPRHYGQLATTVLARNPKSPLVDLHALCWMEWINKYTVRDQISFMHCLWASSAGEKAEENLHWIGPNAFVNEFFHYQGGH